MFIWQHAADFAAVMVDVPFAVGEEDILKAVFRAIDGVDDVEVVERVLLFG